MQHCPSAATFVLGAAHRLRGAADALNPDVARLTAELRQLLGGDFTVSYEYGRRLSTSTAAALLEGELTSAADREG